MSWGLYYQGGSEALVADSVFAFRYSHEYDIPIYPQEQGAFQTYNKVHFPYQANIVFLVGGNSSHRSAFLDQAEALCASTTLLQIITPDYYYPNANATRLSIRERSAEGGITLLQVEILCVEVRNPNTSAGLSSAQSPSASPPASNGLVQPSIITYPLPPVPSGNITPI